MRYAREIQALRRRLDAFAASRVPVTLVIECVGPKGAGAWERTATPPAHDVTVIHRFMPTEGVTWDAESYPRPDGLRKSNRT